MGFFSKLFEKKSIPPQYTDTPISTNVESSLVPGVGRVPFPASMVKPYIFVSYSHTDTDDVFREIKRFHDQGYHVWYDEGIEVGNEWPEEIAEALANCEIFVVMITPRSVNSINVRNEINFALAKQKKFIAIHLEKTELTGGLQLQTGSLQAILRYALPEDGYIYKYTRTFANYGIPIPDTLLAQSSADSPKEPEASKELSPKEPEASKELSLKEPEASKELSPKEPETSKELVSPGDPGDGQTNLDGFAFEIHAAHTGDVVRFGKYQQQDDPSEGKEDIEWIVLAKENNRALLISRYGLDGKQYNKNNEKTTWQSCTLRRWLNRDFLKSAFSPEEQELIVKTKLTNADNRKYGTFGGNDTMDRVFLLSFDEAKKYFNCDDERLRLSTGYARHHGVSWAYNDCSDWWLRSPGPENNCASYVDNEGNVVEGGNDATYCNAICPALWVSLPPLPPSASKESVSSGDSVDKSASLAEFISEINDAYTGDVVLFGKYQQDSDLSKGKEDIEWIVLAKENDRALLISKYGLDGKPYNLKHERITWQICTLRRWLNNDFLKEAFSSEEQELIAETTLANADNRKHGTFGGNDTTDRVFLLSVDEAEKYINSDEERLRLSTGHAHRHGVGYIYNGCSDWWLRSPGQRNNCAAYIGTDGDVREFGTYATQCKAICPALWVRLSP